MADSELSRALKDLPYRLQTSSLKERKEVIQNVIAVLQNPGITENVVKGVCKIVQSVLPRYRDNPSHRSIRNLCSELVKHHPQWTLNNLTQVILDVGMQHKNLVATANTAQTCLYTLQLSCDLMGKMYTTDTTHSHTKDLVEAQMYLVSGILASGVQKKIRRASMAVTETFIAVPECKKYYLETVKSFEPTRFVPIFGAFLCKLLEDKPDLLVEYIPGFLDAFIKSMVSVKVKPDKAHILGCYPLLKITTHEQFKGSLLPALQKSMLRSPEVILECVGLVITGLNLDLSPYAMDLGKSLIANLHSKDDTARRESADACQRLAKQICDLAAVEALLKQTFAVFNGSDGKLTVLEHKMSVLEGAGNFSYNKIFGENALKAASTAVDHFAKALEIEVHEKVLCYALEMLSLWTCKFDKVLPKRLLDCFKNGMSSKTSTPLVRTTNIQCMLASFQESSIGQAAPLVPILLKTIEKAVSQPLLAAAVTEGLYAANMVLKVLASQGEKENNLQVLWNAVSDVEKQLFISDKFLAGASEESLVMVMQLCEHMLIEYPSRISGKTQPFHKAILKCLCYKNYETRKRCISMLKRIVSGLGGTQIAHDLLHEFAVMLESSSFSTKSEAGEIVELSPHIVMECITTLCSASNLSVDDAQMLALAALLPAHHPSVVQIAPELWSKVVKFMKLDPSEFTIKNYKQLQTILHDNYTVSESYENALSTIAQFNGPAFIPRLVESAIADLKDEALLKVTKDDYFTYLTPEGELYDKSVIPGDESNNELNMKRESKAYSFKEQQEELQLRRELEEKKRREGKLKAPQLTPKQLEAIKNQKVKEQAIREDLTKMNAKVEKIVSAIRAVAKGNPQQLSYHYKDLIPVLLTYCKSPLAAPQLTDLFVSLRETVFEGRRLLLSDVIAHVTLRLLKPQCDLSSCWEEEDLTKAMIRTIEIIHKETVKKHDADEHDQAMRSHFDAPAFAYIFPLVKACLTSKQAKKDENIIHVGLQIISEHAKMRGRIADEDNDVFHPKLLPRKNMFELLIDLISSTSGRIQSQAVATLLDVASSASGAPTCSVATLDEISVLMSALQSPASVVRDSALRGLTIIKSSIPTYEINYDEAVTISKRIWISKFDVDEANRDLANKLWEDANLSFPADLNEELIRDIEHPVECIQVSAAEALAVLITDNKHYVAPLLQRLMKLYRQRLTMIPPKVDEFGREVEKSIDTWSPRRGVALALTQLAPLLDYDVIGTLVEFFVSTSLADRKENVRKEMLNACLKVVDLHGKDTVSTLLPVFENFMDRSSKSASYDHVKQAVVILMGSLARHLEKDDARIKPIVQRLIQALSTPSQQVQEAVANCLPHLVPCVKEEAPGYINKVLHQLLKGDKYGDRKGAAYGLAGLVKGMGILALKQLDIMTKLTEAIQDKNNYKHREGALFAFEMLFQMLGKLFEPYIVHVLPHLLLCFGDTSQYVRNATDDTAKVVMSKLSGHGVKLVLPSLLAALEDDSWRTKTGSVELLGAMAYCAPKQLSSCLPSIVPKLIEVLSDSHMKVQESGAEALRVIGSVIRNPEIQAIVPVLLLALQDPSHKTSACLQTLLDTQFVHFIDAPSLALIMPVVQRAFMDRSTETRKMAAQIIGNMYSLTDQKDLMPYLPTIIPGLKTSLLDPVPEVRSVSARALGAMVRGMGESSFEDLLPWLMQTLTSESSSVDRSGAAQGLSEVVGGLGVEKLHKLMPEIIATAERTDIAPHVKDGYIMMFIYMPVVFQSEFTPYIGQIINPILKALADENEYVRDTALKAGQRIVTLYADSAILLLLPELERGLFDDNWRIRYSSVQLLGDLLYRISGVTGKMSTETASEDDNFGTEQSHLAIISSLGDERRNRVLAGLYMGRSDVALMVRQAALHVWKVVVTNTPRTLREILPTLFGLLLGCLASDSYDKRQVAARTLGDLVRKLGERVLPEIIPILERGLQSERADQRQGVCIGLSEIMASTSREMVLTFVNSLVPTVRKALCDPLPEVREAAAKTFDSLHSTVGTKALDDILPSMLNQLNNADAELAEWTLDGLRQVMAIKSRVVLPYLVPQLTAPPANTKALSILASVAGDSLNKYLPKILPALQTALASSNGTQDETQQLEYCQAVILSVVDDAGIRTVIDTLLESTKHESADQRRAAATLLCAFCANSRAQYISHVPQLYRGLIHLCIDTNKEVLQMTWEALNAITKSLDAKQQSTYVSDVRQAVRYAVYDIKGSSDLLPGFCLPKGIAPILPIFREAILNGDGDEKEAAAQGLGEVIKLTSAPALQSSVVAITGPLIRILGDRFNPNVKTAVLETLAILLAKVGVMLKQFLPQLQTTFVKALNDTNRVVRLKSANALSYLILIHQRPDPLFTELHNSIKNTDDVSIRETTLHALRGIISPAGDKMTEVIRKQIHQTLVGMMGHQEDVTRACASGCLGALCKYLSPEQLAATLSEHLLCDDTNAEWTLRHGRSAALAVTLKECPEIIWDDKFKPKVEKTLLSLLAADKVQITMTGIRSCGYLLQYLMSNGHPLPLNVIGPFVKTMNNSNNEVKQLLARVCIHLAKNIPSEKMAPELLRLLLPMLVNGTKEKNSYVKANSELALIAVLKLKEGDEVSQKCLNILDLGARESLSDVVSKVLKKILHQPEGKEEELDDTLLT